MNAALVFNRYCNPFGIAKSINDDVYIFCFAIIVCTLLLFILHYDIVIGIYRINGGM